MKNFGSGARWAEVFLAALVSGSAASLASTTVLSICGRREECDPSGPLNGPSQWLWGRSAAHESGFSVRHTVAGFAIHHAMSVFWAAFFEGLLHRKRPSSTAVVGTALATAAVACVVDYRVVPERLTPGFEHHLSRKSLALTYVVFGLALAGTFLAARKR